MSFLKGLGAGLDFDARSTIPERPNHSGGGYFGSMLRRAIAGVPVTTDSALTYSAVFGCVRLISEHVAMMPHHVFVNTDRGRSVVSDHPVDHLLYRQSNPETNAFDFKQTVVAHALLKGNGFAEVERLNNGDPGALWQIDWDRVNPVRDADGRLMYEVSNGSAANTILRPSDCIHLKGFSLDGITGLSVVAFAKQAISLGLAMEHFGAAFFGNGAMPGGVIEWADAAVTPDEWGADAAKNLKSSWKKDFKGSGNNGGIAVLEPGQRFKPISIAPDEAQFLESRKFGVGEIARWFGVPPHKIGDLERSTNSNIEAQNIEYVSDCLMRWAIRFEQEINAKLLRGGHYNKINFNGLLRGDLKSRKEYFQTMLDRGVLSINEVRALEEQNPVEGGDLHLVQMNMISLEQANKNGNTGKKGASDV